MAKRTALLVGATGLVGGQCLRLLLRDEAYAKVVSLGRRTLPLEDPKLEQHVVDFDRLSEFGDVVTGQDVFCCLGTTISKAGSREAFRRVDFEYQHGVARVAAGSGAEQLLLVSSLGANHRSSVFYSRVKGELERAVSVLPFAAVNIFRPSLLLGERAEYRLGERVAERVLRYSSFLLKGPLGKYRPVRADAVAAAMVRVAARRGRGVNVFESDAVRELGALTARERER